MDICDGIRKDLAGDALENQLQKLHDALFGSSQDCEYESIQAHVDIAVEELKIKIQGKLSRKSFENPAFVAEASLLLGLVLISSFKNSSFEPKVDAYLSQLENFLLPRVFSRTQISPNHFRNILLKCPINYFVRLPEDQKKEEYCNNVQELLKSLKLNFGIDLLLQRDDNKRTDFFEMINPPLGIQPIKSGKTRVQSPSYTLPKKMQLCTPKYLLTRKRKVVRQERNIVPREESRNMECAKRTPENSDDEVLEGETPEKRRRL